MARQNYTLVGKLKATIEHRGFKKRGKYYDVAVYLVNDDKPVLVKDEMQKFFKLDPKYFEEDIKVGIDMLDDYTVSLANGADVLFIVVSIAEKMSKVHQANTSGVVSLAPSEIEKYIK